MKIEVDIHLSKENVMDLLRRFDDSSDIPLSEGLDFDAYSEKLCQNAYFILAIDEDRLAGFVAYYLNKEGKFVYVPQVVIHKDWRHQGLGHKMFSLLHSTYADKYNEVRLEVLKKNINARAFYEREGYKTISESDDRLQLKRSI